MSHFFVLLLHFLLFHNEIKQIYFQIAENFDMPFFEVSCKNNINIEDAFLSLARKIREQRERRVT